MQKLRVIVGSLALVAVMSGGLSTPAGAAGPEVKGLIESERTISTFLLGEMKTLQEQAAGVTVQGGTLYPFIAKCPKVQQALFEIASGLIEAKADAGRILQGFLADRSDAMMMAASSARPLDTSSMPTYKIEVELAKGVTAQRLTAALDEVMAYAGYDADLRKR